ncbi:5-hydroxytryptamine receptor 3A-like [Plectropomus leopardus]|uniref:5-hydroxytryptamine receptor 3A-like n=1 Tax=Plectropomus leopardus TaxID=160734 RepID=UPI001C4CB000|nr:5-hydroxytryptamine receptor 3A-like [Plectropomus leopardus]
MIAVKPCELLLICFTLLYGFGAAFNCTSPTPEALFDALEKNLFTKTLLRPVKSFSDPLNITISITVVGIIGVDEKSQTLTTLIWQILEWNIAGLSWDEKECGTKRVSVPRDRLWIPDVHIAEFMEEDKSPKTPYVYLQNTGDVFDDKPVRVASSCKLGIYTFPFDIQNCTLTFGSYLHFAVDVTVLRGATAQEILEESQEVMETNGEWELAGLSISTFNLALEEGSYSEIKYHLIIKRRPLLYVVNLLIPSCFLITVDLFSFLLPPASVDRSSFKMTLILGYTVFLLIMNDLLPVTGETTPLINVFFSISLALMVASLLETVFITNIQFSSSQYSAVPNWLSVLVLRYLAVVVCLPRKKKSNKITVNLNPSNKEPGMNSSITSVSVIHPKSIFGDTPPVKLLEAPSPPQDPIVDELRKLSKDLSAIRHQIDNHSQGSKTSQEWQMVGVVIDRLLFCLYIIFIVVSFIAIISIWVWNNSYSP